MIERPGAAPESWCTAAPSRRAPCPSTGAGPAAVVVVVGLLVLGLAAGDLRSLLVVAIGAALTAGG